MRPTSDRLRETFFNILGPSVADSFFVDIYAGTGAIGIEAVSRGARETVFIESNRRSALLIRQNLELLGIRAGIEMIEADATQGLERLAARKLVADFIFLDPPYEERDEHLRVLEFLDASRLIAPSGLIIAEHHRKMELPKQLVRLEQMRVVEQGDAALSFYRLAAAA